ncbi:MAG: type II secretion system protein [Limisphaerales bacterium]
MPRKPRVGGAGSGGFTLIEMIGVVSILAVCAAVVTPGLARRLSRAKAAEDAAELSAIGDALRRHVALHQEIPGPGSWAAKAASIVGQPPQAIQDAIPGEPSSARVYLIHPDFAPASPRRAKSGDPLWVQGAEGTVHVSEARVLLLSVHRTGLRLPVASGVASSAKAFDHIWDWYFDPKTGAPPIGWPSAWQRNGEYLHVERINFEPLFRKVTFSNTQFPEKAPSFQVANASVRSLVGAPTYDAYFLEGSFLRMFQDPSGRGRTGTVQLALTVRDDLNLVYADDHWRIP